ncbi:hypothetical protein AB8Z38_36740 [Bradyrhizobium sp. LLZ17]|uniref:Uncharacterized protein n=1 Tax=Bradyrhizobium sp. LLZ17 TaxID=3239388 RepID=A0AB39XJ66_9BRAD
MNPFIDFGYRLLAFAVSVYCARKLWYGYVDRKILFVNTDWLAWSRQVFYRDTMPIRYWMQMCGTGFCSVLCLVGVFMSWQQLNPNGNFAVCCGPAVDFSNAVINICV